MSQTNPQTPAKHEMAAVVLDRLFTGDQTAAGLGGERVLDVQRHIAECDACRRRFDRLAESDRALLGRADDGVPGEFERDFRDASVLGAIDEMLAQEQPNGQQATDGGATVVSLTERSTWQRLAMPLVSAAIVLFVVGVSIWAPNNDFIRIGGSDGASDEAFQPRSATRVGDTRAYEKPRIELFCARQVDGDVQFQGSSDAPFGLLSCPDDAKFKVGYSSTDSNLRHAAFFGVDRAGELYWYGPSPTRVQPWRIQPHEKISPVGDTIDLGVNHEPGPVRVYGLFTPEPVEFGELESMLRASDTAALFESGDFTQFDFEGAWATETFEVVEEGAR
ncbi:MAG: hypothetical protein ACQEVA_05070 [Myxococcota bacterium]